MSCHDLLATWTVNLSKMSATITQVSSKDADVPTASLPPIRDPSCYAPTTQPSLQPAINDIDGYLSTIGFAPPTTDNFANTATGNDQLDATYLNDWFYGNSSLMGLLEQDITYEWPDLNFMTAQQ